MTELPVKTIEGALRLHGHASTVAMMDPALGPDRLVVAGPHEQEIIEKVCRWLDADALKARNWGDEATANTLTRVADRLLVGGIPQS